MAGVAAFLRHPATVRTCRYVLGFFLAWAALAKIGSAADFASNVHNFRMVPVAFENLVALTLPWIELVVAMALFLGVEARSGAVLGTGLLVFFTVAIVAAVFRGLDIDCGCFGTSDGAQAGVKKIVENVFLIAVGCVASLRRQ